MWVEAHDGALINLADARSIRVVQSRDGYRLVAGYPGGSYVDLTCDLSEQVAWRVQQYLIAAMERGDAVAHMHELIADACEPELEALQNATARG